MKKLLLFVVIIMMTNSVLNAQNRKPEWATLKTPSVKCWQCKERVENYFKEEISQTEGGIIKLQINSLSGTSRVQFWPDRVNLDYIRTIFANAGFDADDMKAEPDSYNKLPKACKRAEDGGGPEKGKPCHAKPYN